MNAAAVPRGPELLVHEPFPPEHTDLVRAYVWEWPVRVTHWLVVVSIAVLSVSGFLIGTPSLVVRFPLGGTLNTGALKLVHSYAACVFTLSVLSRIAWMFLGNRFARWDKFLPVRGRRRRHLLPTLRFYLFALRKPPGFIGHNPLAGITYFWVFVLYLVMITTGLALYSASADVRSPLRLFEFLGPLWGGLQTARFVHHGVMWLLLAFAVHHVYSAILMSQIEANATMESIFSGYKFVHRDDVLYSGYRFHDPKDVEHDGHGDGKARAREAEARRTDEAGESRSDAA